MTDSEKLNLLLEKMGSMEAEMGGIKAEVGEVKAEVGGIKAEIGEMKEEIGGLKAEIGEVKKGVKSLEIITQDLKSMDKLILDEVVRVYELMTKRTSDLEKKIG